MYDLMNTSNMDTDIRERALTLAVKSCNTSNGSDFILAKAKAFEDYLRGPEKSSGDRNTEPTNEKVLVDEDGNRLPPEIARIKKMFEDTFGTEVVFKKYKGDY